MTGSDSLVVRPVADSDLPAVLDLLAASMKRDRSDARFEALFRWKHYDNAFGRSPGWVAMEGERLAGFRIMMRWEFTRRDDRFRAVRAVDTATHPDFQGRGIFTRLTKGALDSLRAEGIDFVFNTPNDQSRPGYLKMGWREVGVLPVRARLLSPAGIVRMARARVPAEHWSLPTTAGEPAIDVLAPRDDLDALLASLPAPPRLRTRRTSAFLAWRYGLPDLDYRAMVLGGDLRRGVALFRVRRRGPARELVLADVVAPSAPDEVALTRAVVRAGRGVADYVVAIGDPPLRTFLTVPGQGPMLTWRAVTSEEFPPAPAWQLGLGDIELF